MQRADAVRALFTQLHRASEGGLVHTTSEVVNAILGLDEDCRHIALLEQAARLLHAHMQDHKDSQCRFDADGDCVPHHYANPCKIAETRVFLEENKL